MPCKKCRGKAFFWFFEHPQFQKTMSGGGCACASRHPSTAIQCPGECGLEQHPLPMAQVGGWWDDLGIFHSHTKMPPPTTSLTSLFPRFIRCVG